MNFDLNPTEREAITKLVFEKLEHFYNNTKDFPITPNLDKTQISNFINSLDFQNGVEPKQGIEHVTKGLESSSVHTPHPNYFGLFNPRANFAGIIADWITAGYNPQLAAWSHAPFAVEVEAKLIRDFGERFGYDPSTCDGVFTTGGAEANLTAVLAALNHRYPSFAEQGIFGMDQKPIIFCSAEAHHSVQKSAKVVGLGYSSVRTIKTEENLKMNLLALEKSIEACLANNEAPLMVIGTAGTTGTGTIDDLMGIHAICKKYGIWFHADAAWGGGAILSSDLRQHLEGIAHSDSITFDAHKWMSVPMGTSLFLTRHKDILAKTFRITTEYMPKEAKDLGVVDPFTHSIQWSRRFIGLKVYLSLLFYGWEGYEKTINHQSQMGNYLKDQLQQDAWSIKNDTPFPVVCFTDERFQDQPAFTQQILTRIIANRKSWLSVYPINGVSCFRACITNYNTTQQEVEELIVELNNGRDEFAQTC